MSPTLSTYDLCSQSLNILVTEVSQADLRNIVTTLLKIVTNITQNPMEPKFRKLPKNSKSMQEKILRYAQASNFLFAAGF